MAGNRTAYKTMTALHYVAVWLGKYLGSSLTVSVALFAASNYF